MQRPMVLLSILKIPILLSAKCSPSVVWFGGLVVWLVGLVWFQIFAGVVVVPFVQGPAGAQPEARTATSTPGSQSLGCAPSRPTARLTRVEPRAALCPSWARRASPYIPLGGGRARFIVACWVTVVLVRWYEEI